MKIVLDAMGGDIGPAVNVEAAIRAARTYGYEIVLVGKQEQIRPLLAQQQTAGLMLPIVHASEVIEMDEHPAAAVKAKKDSSMAVGIELVKRGDADAFVTMGNTGGAFATALFKLGRIGGIQRAALSTAYPTIRGWSLILDIGANADCKPEYLVQFALMGSIYAERVLNIRKPKVALVSNGEEETKGSQLVQETHQLLKKAPINFIGNAEGKDIPAGLADVYVTDGFTGNVIIKLSEGLGSMIKQMLREEIMRTTTGKLGGLLIKNAVQRMSKRTDYEEIGGAPLLGVDGVVIIGHGRSNARAIQNAIRVAAQTVEKGVVDAIERGLEALPQISQ
ncbi:MAG: phosphate acyltransferase PlsX [Anaerolineae bacterium]|nr:phosphate acyltransferase PlsX [Thermoflexales bacterium]MDW8406978.1 phosphate acyltransferase PlsX [Anaerolineae bacterium]